MTQLGGKGALRSNDRKIQNTAPKPSRRAKICDQQQTDEISGLGWRCYWVELEVAGSGFR